MAQKSQYLSKILFGIIVTIYILCENILADFVVDKIMKNKFPAELHFIQTDDGYILGVHRIRRQQHSHNYRGVMFLMHGMFGSSPGYVAYPNISAGYYFWNAGYDVWMGNARGNLFSRNHTTLDPDKAEFWKFSWHEIGYYDLPAMIDYALKNSNQTNLMYIGHSQGVTSAMVMLSIRPEYNRKIKILHAMSPPVILKYPPLIYLEMFVDMAMQHIKLIEEVVTSVQMYELCSSSQRSQIQPIGKLCSNSSLIPFCRVFSALLFGPSPHYYDKLLDTVLDHVPAGVSFRQVIHYGILVNSGEFKQYDHGLQENLRLYGVETAPAYNLSNVRSRIHIIYGGNDKLVVPANIPLFKEQIRRNVIATSEFNDYNHIDFVYSKDILQVHAKIASIIRRVEMSKNMKPFF